MASFVVLPILYVNCASSKALHSEVIKTARIQLFPVLMIRYLHPESSQRLGKNFTFLHAATREQKAQISGLFPGLCSLYSAEVRQWLFGHSGVKELFPVFRGFLLMSNITAGKQRFPRSKCTYCILFKYDFDSNCQHLFPEMSEL